MTAQARGGRTTTGRAAAKKPEPKPDPDLVVIDLNDFTAAEVESIEELTGQPITRSSDLKQPQGAMMRAMGWVIRLRTDPDVPYEDNDCGRGQRPSCGDCHCSRRLKVGFRVVAAPVPPSGGNGS